MAKVPQFRIEYMATDSLIPYARNAKIHTDEQVRQIADSMEAFGFNDPVGVWTRRDGKVEIVEGHGRVMAAQLLGIEKVPVIRLDHMTDDERRAYVHVHNQTTLSSGFDMEALKLDLDGIQIDTSPWFEGRDLSWAVGKEQVEETEVPEDVEPRAKRGDVWQLGRHRVMCGDSTDPAVVDRLMDGVKADMCFQSPPYNIGKNAQLNDRDDDNKYINYNDDNPEYRELLTTTTENAINNSRYVGINIQMLSGNKKDFVLWLSDFREQLCDIAIWYKDNVAPAMARRVMNSAFEFIVFFSRENQSRAIGTNDFRGTVSNVYQSHIQSGNEYSKIHSATFPVNFAGHFIDCFTNKGDTVLDLFGGSGTTLIAAEQLGRTCYMMELDPHYVDVIVKRWETLTGGTAELAQGRQG